MYGTLNRLRQDNLGTWYVALSRISKPNQQICLEVIMPNGLADLVEDNCRVAWTDDFVWLEVFDTPVKCERGNRSFIVKIS